MEADKLRNDDVISLLPGQYTNISVLGILYELEYARLSHYTCIYIYIYTVKRFGCLQPYFGHLSCIPFVCVTCKVQCNLNGV